MGLVQFSSFTLKVRMAPLALLRTFTVTVLLFPPDFTVICAVPSDTPRARPLLLTVTTELLLLEKVAVAGAVVPSSCVPMALSVMVSPTPRYSGEGETVIAVNGPPGPVESLQAGSPARATSRTSRVRFMMGSHG